jgi:hypothetical protein
MPVRNEQWWDKEPWWLGVLALPFLQVKNLSLLMSGETWAAKVGLLIYFLPFFAWTTALWLAAWFLASAILWRLLRELWL